MKNEETEIKPPNRLDVKNKIKEALDLAKTLPSSRHIALVITKLEEAEDRINRSIEND